MHEHATEGRRSSVSRQRTSRGQISEMQRRDNGCWPSVKLSARCESVAADWTLTAPVAAVRFVALFAPDTTAPRCASLLSPARVGSDRRAQRAVRRSSDRTGGGDGDGRRRLHLSISRPGPQCSHRLHRGPITSARVCSTVEHGSESRMIPVTEEGADGPDGCSGLSFTVVQCVCSRHGRMALVDRECRHAAS